MNEDFADIENELRALVPLAPSAALETRVAQALEAAPVERTAVRWWQRMGFYRPLTALAWGIAVPATAVLVLLVLRAGGLPVDRPHAGRFASPSGAVARSSGTRATGPDLELSEASNELYQTSDEGVVYDEERRQPLRQVRYRSRDTLEWRNRQTGARYEVSYPREDVVLTPINLQ